MNLNQMSSTYFGITGNYTGFQLKSRVTGRIFTAVSQTPSGRSFLIVSQDGTKEDLVLADADRYEFADPTLAATGTRRTAINERIVELMSKETELESKLDTVESELDQVRDELSDLEVELENLD
jgi:hypothetical protein